MTEPKFINLCSASGDACAQVYNLNQHTQYEFPELTSELVWNAFYLHTLLAYYAHMSSTLAPEEACTTGHLQLPHHGDNCDRLTAALNKWNQAMAGTGQAQWVHACDNCEKLVPPAPGSPEGTLWCKFPLQIQIHFSVVAEN